jgi:putative ABC transport system permease protein
VGVAIGIPLGWLWLQILVHLKRFKAMFDSVGATLSPGGLLLAGGGSLVAALLASLLPAWSATRVDPLDAMRPLASGNVGGIPWKVVLLGFLLIWIDPLLLFGPVDAITNLFNVADPRQLDASTRFYGHFIIGLPTAFLGFFLMAPLFVWLLERVLGPVLAWVMRVQYPMLRQQLSAGIWRAAGSAAALMVGLAVLTVMQTQGNSALKSWNLPVHFPDVFIYSRVALTPQDQKILAETPGIRDGDIMPIAIASPDLGSNIYAIAGAMMLPNATMYFGVDPDKALGVPGHAGMMELEFRDDQGQRVSQAEQQRLMAEAREQLKRGQHVIVTDEFRQLRGLKRGDKIKLKTNQGLVDFTIAGIVWSPGMDVINSKFDLGRQFEQRTAASLFGTLEDAKTYFGANDIYLFAANLDFFKERDAMLKDVQQRLGKMNMSIGDVRQIKKSIQDGLGNLLLLVSTVAFAAMGVASLGVTNTIMASVRSRQWQFGVLRSIGVTRGQLLRLVISEAALLGVVGVGLGLSLGLFMAVNARQETVIVLGIKWAMVIPWGIISVGIGTVMVISLLASIVPAVQAARAEPLELLQAGRSST